MTAVGVLVLVVAALGVGYQAGRHANPRVPTWRQRTRRAALGRQALALAVLMSAARLERSVHRRLPPLARRGAPTYVGRILRVARR